MTTKVLKHLSLTETGYTAYQKSVQGLSQEKVPSGEFESARARLEDRLDDLWDYEAEVVEALQKSKDQAQERYIYYKELARVELEEKIEQGIKQFEEVVGRLNRG